jgi:hypothetical protein
VLTIRNEQMLVFRRNLEHEFIERLADRLEIVFPDRAAALGRAAVEKQAGSAYSRARSYGLNSKSDVIRFVDVDFVVGADFENAPDMKWALLMLQDDDLSPANKIFRLTRRLQLRGIGIYSDKKEGTTSAR